MSLINNLKFLWELRQSERRENLNKINNNFNKNNNNSSGK